MVYHAYCAPVQHSDFCIFFFYCLIFSVSCFSFLYFLFHIVLSVSRGFITLVTGSKFFEGPPFSGAVVLPPSMAVEIETHILSCTGTGAVLKAVEYNCFLFSCRKTYKVSKNIYSFSFSFSFFNFFFCRFPTRCCVCCP
jgi:hypothetical protein